MQSNRVQTFLEFWQSQWPSFWKTGRNADWVACTAHPRPGYTFVRWKGEGVAWIVDWSLPRGLRLCCVVNTLRR